MKKFILIAIVLITAIGILSISSCKRNGVADPERIGPAGFRIIMSGAANPATLYIPESEPTVSALITVTAKNNDATPVVGKKVVFQTGYYGYFNNYQISDVRTTDSTGTAQVTFYIPQYSNIKTTVSDTITVTLVDDGRLDSSHGQISDSIPIRIVPYMQQGFIVQGHCYTPAGNGVSGIVVNMTGSEGSATATMVTHSGGRYEFYVAGGWTGEVTAASETYSFNPESYTFDVNNPINLDTYGLDFVAELSVGNTIGTDLSTWTVPVQGGVQVVNVFNLTGDSSLSYMVIPSTQWMQISTSSGSTPGSFTITVGENTTGSTRDGSIDVVDSETGTTVTLEINQLANEVSSEATISVDRNSLTFPDTGSTETITVYNGTSSDSINYIISANESWIELSLLSGNTESTFDVVVASHSGAARTGTITVTATDTGILNPTVTISVNQEGGPELTVTPSTISASATAGERFTVSLVNSGTSDVIDWYMTNTDSWLGVEPTGGLTDGTADIIVQSANPSSVPRQGKVTFTGTVIRDGVSITLSTEVIVTQAGS
ncbi:MAG: BACON domain-containing protein [bacterium]|nr:BACON domain-containing protein [bacterium]